MLLRKLGTYARENLSYRAFRELGRVQRTMFYLRLISAPGIRRAIRAETTKIEAYND
jgi:TnpA family transposase